MQLRGEAGLAINNLLCCPGLNEFLAHAKEIFGALHEFKREVNAANVVGQVETDFGRDQRFAQRRGKGHAGSEHDLAGSLQAQAAVEVAVQFELGECAVVRHYSPQRARRATKVTPQSIAQSVVKAIDLVEQTMFLESLVVPRVLCGGSSHAARSAINSPNWPRSCGGSA